MEEEIYIRLRFLRESLAISRSNLTVEERIIKRRKLIREYYPKKETRWQLFCRELAGKRAWDAYSSNLEIFAGYIALGKDLEEAGRLDEALEAFATAPSYHYMARVYLKLSQRENALAILKRADQGGRKPPEALLLEAEIRGEFGEYSEVTYLLNLAFCRTPENNETPQIYQRIQELGERFSVPIPRLPDISPLARTAPG